MGLRRARIVLLLSLFFATPAAAQRLPSGVAPTHYDLVFVVGLVREGLDGTETIQVEVAEPTSRIVVNAVDITFREVTIGSGAAAQKAAVALDDGKQTAAFTVARAIPKGAAEIHVRYGGTLNSQ